MVILFRYMVILTGAELLQCGALCCSVLQCDAVWCSVMQCDAV